MPGIEPPELHFDAGGTVAEICLPTNDPQEDASFFSERLGFRLESIFPADDPREAVISGHGLRVRLQRGIDTSPGTMRLISDDPVSVAGGVTQLTAPNGTRIEICGREKSLIVPQPPRTRVISRHGADDAWVTGRAGMQYRDLIPGRLGGSVIASQIRIPDGGPVPDMVHFHNVAFQLIYCYRGWVKVAYAEQGEPIVLEAGDGLIQPPQIRHRVLEASDGMEVIEVTVPAEHMTTIDHELPLPGPLGDRERRYAGQRLVSFRGAALDWHPGRIPGFEAADSGIFDATQGAADVRVVRWRGAPEAATSHTAEILFSFVLDGALTLSQPDLPGERLEAGDAFVLPPGTPVTLSECTDDLALLQVALPGAFETVVHDA
jgi:quercetin dioxygenase-like cupin family protein